MASGGESTQICGIAKQVDLYNLKVIGKNGKGNVKDIIMAVEWSIEHKMDIINMSIGHSMSEKHNGDKIERFLAEEKKVIQKAIDSGIVVIGAIGNIPEKDIQAPACYEGVISVGSYGVKNTVPIEFYISKKNSKYNNETIFAPGEYVLTTTKGGAYGYDSGSSIATIHITAVAAYMKAIRPNLTSRQLCDILLKTSSVAKFQEGCINILNVGRAIELVESLD